ncbi:choline dehydrogenase [Halioxenophilus sp. WMMB6]|uniref:GMC family oxidoreductase n=1 Tax=Halioxenophilus sp. WMMB6 TaxID=3073815 RepID=UPI00295E43C5|nr:choline dehydrogenase [Halioxenophilus sp. WMMB6]
MTKNSGNTADYIIIGGGSAGCVLANRLSEDPATKVTLIEAGPRDSNPWIRLPSGLIPLVNGTYCNWKYWSEPQRHLHNRRLYQPRGKVLGGCSSINAQVYVRGNAEDYNGWSQLGCEGWSYSEVLPYFLKMEDFQPDTSPANSRYHNRGGPLTISNREFINPLTEAFLKAAEQAGHARNDDHNGACQEGIGILYSYNRDGQRCNNARAYLDPARPRANLQIITNAQVHRLIISQGQVEGVEYSQNSHSQKLYCSEEVILSAGAFNSPQLLMISGIGPETELKKHDIPLKLHLPGVGQNLQDHLNLYVETRSKSRVGMSFHSSSWLRYTRECLKYALFTKGELTSNLLEAGGFIKCNPNQITPDLQFHFLPSFGAHHGLDLSNLKKHYGYSLIFNDNRPHSRGSLTLQSSSITDAPRIDPNYLSDERDVQQLVQGVREARKILAQPAFDDHRECEISPGDALQSDEQLTEWVRNNAETVYHPACTCKMGVATDPLAVVDSQLRVWGIDKLRVADASIMPNLVSGNTNAACTMIGEKAAAMILNQETAQPRKPEDAIPYATV